MFEDRLLQLEKQNASKNKVVWDESLQLAVARSEHIAIGRFYGDNFDVLRYGSISNRKGVSNASIEN